MSEQPWERLSRLEAKLVEAVPPIDPEPCHWLNSVASASYCYEHAWAARWSELPTFGPPPPIPDWFRRSCLEQIIADGIDGCAGMGGESDHSEACETCGCTLEYLLTDYGRSDELSHFEENPIQPGDEINGELTYCLTRIFMNLDYPGAPEADVLAAVKIAEDALTALGETP